MRLGLRFCLWWLPPVERHKANPGGDEDDTHTELAAGTASVTPLGSYGHLPVIRCVTDVSAFKAALEGTPDGGTAGGAAIKRTAADAKRHFLAVGRHRHDNPHSEKSNPRPPPDRHDTTLSPSRDHAGRSSDRHPQSEPPRTYSGERPEPI